jgi:hypothetical protein
MLEIFGGPDRDRTDDLFHAIYRRHSTYEPAQPAELTPWALFAHKMPPNFWEAGHGLICVGSTQNFSAWLDSGYTFSANRSSCWI